MTAIPGEGAPGRAAGPWATWLLYAASLTYNVAISSLPTWLYVWAYTPLNVMAAALVLWVARRWFGLDWRRFGVTRTALLPGIAWGVAGVLIAGVAVLVVSALAPRALTLPPAAPKPATWPDLLFQVFVRIPLGTVLLEELLFRGILVQQFRRHWSVVTAAMLSSLAFGLWHVGFAIRSLSAVPEAAAVTIGTLLAFIGATVVFGLLTVWLAAKSRTLVAPMTTHWLLNAAGAAATFLMRP